MSVKRVTPELLVTLAVFSDLLRLVQGVTGLSIKQLNLSHYAQDIIKRNIMGENKLLYNFGENFQR